MAASRKIRPAFCVFVVSISIAMIAATTVIANRQPFRDPAGQVATFNLAGNIDERNAFFQSLGTNGRSCGTCHVPSQGFSFSAAGATERFAASKGADPLFALVDGANCSELPRDLASSHSLLLNNGLIRISLPVPANAEFTITAVSDPYGCALVTDAASGQQTVSVYRRPLPSTNLRFLSTVMSDGRETVQPLDNGQTSVANLITDLKHQAMDATLGHAQAAAAPSDAQLTEIVAFELGLSTAQVQSSVAGDLSGQGAHGGPVFLSKQPYHPGINDSLGPNFESTVFTVFQPWNNLPDAGNGADKARADIAAGERIFNTHSFTIRGVRGINDNAALGRPVSMSGTCTTCHDTPNVGNHSLPLPLDIAVSHAPLFETDAAISAGLANLSVPDLPVFHIAGCKDPVTGDPVDFYTSDPGKALISGKCVDVNRVKGPILRGLAARAPYFHNGAAANLNEVVNFYNDRFQMGLTEEEKAQLVEFLNSL